MQRAKHICSPGWLFFEIQLTRLRFLSIPSKDFWQPRLLFKYVWQSNKIIILFSCSVSKPQKRKLQASTERVEWNIFCTAAVANETFYAKWNKWVSSLHAFSRELAAASARPQYPSTRGPVWAYVCICIGVCVWVLGGAGMCGAKKVVPLASCALIKQRTPAICLNTRLFITNFMELPGT